MRNRLICFILAAFVSLNMNGQEMVFPGIGWEIVSPGSKHLDAASLDSIATLLGGRGCIVKDGYIVKTWGEQAKRTDWMSAVKPLFSTFLFFAIDEEKIPGVHFQIRNLDWDLAEKDVEMEFYHLANMCSGYALKEIPGEAWAYNDFAIQLYQKSLFERVFREDPDTVLAIRLSSLQFEDKPYFRDDKPRFYASVRDFARIGWFWLNQGEWNEHALIPRDYFDRYMKPQVPFDLPQAEKCDEYDYLQIGSFGGGADHFTKYGAGIYGFNWWFNATGRLHPEKKTWPDATDGTFMAIGAGGNVMAMIPELNIVLSSAQGHWGSLKPGNQNSRYNLAMKLIVEATR